MDRSRYDQPTAWGLYTEASTKTPGFHKLKRLGVKLPEKPYSWYRIDGVSPYSYNANGPYTERQNRGFTTLYDTMRTGYVSTQTGVNVPIQTTADVIGIVRNRLLEKIRDQDIDLGVALFEARETASFVSNAMIKTVKSYRQLRRGDVSGALRTLTGKENRNWRDIPGAASNTWLAYSYGLRPLLQDVHGACEALNKRSDPYYEVKTARSGKVQHVAGEAHHGSAYHNKVSGDIKVRGRISFKVNNPLLRVAGTLGLTNPLATIWELVPFSFVVDWFLPIGDFFQGIVPPQGVDFADGWISSKCTGTASAWTTIPQWGLAYSVATSKEVIKDRIILSEFPRYHLVAPDFSLSKSQIASGLALLWSVRHK